MAKEVDMVPIFKRSRQDAMREAKEILHQQGVSHENERLFQQALQLIVTAWDHLGIIQD